MENIELIADILGTINPFKGTVDDLKKDPNFVKLVSACENIKEICSIRFAQKEGVVGILYAIPSTTFEQDPSILEKIYGDSFKTIPFNELESAGETIKFKR